MSLGWTLFISIFTIANIFGCLWLLWWTRRRRDEPGAQAQTTGHVWDGDLREYNNPLPRWWLNLFYITIVFALGYLVLYPGLGSFAGTLGWTSNAQHAAEVRAADEKIAPLFASFREKSIAELSQDPQALTLGANIFAANCATCHGSDARGARGFPNLMDTDWLWGGDPETVLTTIRQGRQAVMPGWGQLLGDKGVNEATVYVQSLSSQSVDPALAARGKVHFETICVACHAADGTGNQALGSPNLTDNVWLYGSDFAIIADGVRNGHSGYMPPHEPIIGEDRVRLAAAWLLSHHPQMLVGPAPAAMHAAPAAPAALTMAPTDAAPTRAAASVDAPDGR